MVLSCSAREGVGSFGSPLLMVLCLLGLLSPLTSLGLRLRQRESISFPFFPSCIPFYRSFSRERWVPQLSCSRVEKSFRNPDLGRKAGRFIFSPSLTGVRITWETHLWALSRTVFLGQFNWGKAHPKCRWHHQIGSCFELNQEIKEEAT